MTNAFFFAHYTAWSIIWGHVLVYYAFFSHTAWRESGGRWRCVPLELWRLVKFTFVPLVTDVRDLIAGRPLVTDVPEYRYAKAHRISFFITMAAVVYMLMGAIYAFSPDRSGWPAEMLVPRFLLIAGTSIAGLGHLFTALEHRPRVWRLFVVAILLWYPMAMLGYELTEPHHQSGGWFSEV
jgi:hypothetical protein